MDKSLLQLLGQLVGDYEYHVLINLKISITHSLGSMHN